MLRLGSTDSQDVSELDDKAVLVVKTQHYLENKASYSEDAETVTSFMKTPLKRNVVNDDNQDQPQL